MSQTLTQDRTWSQIVARAWTDDEFRGRLIADPRSVLEEHGIETPEGVEIQVMEDTENVRHLILPPSPAEELSEEDLVGSEVAYCYCGFCGRCGHCGCWCRGCV